MNEMSRRAEDIGFSYDDARPPAPVDVSDASGMSRVSNSLADGPSSRSDTLMGSSDERGQRERENQPSSSSGAARTSNSNNAGNDDNQMRPPSRIWQAAANAGLFNGLGIGSAFSNGAATGTNMGGIRDSRDLREMLERLDDDGAWIAAQGLSSLGSGVGGASARTDNNAGFRRPNIQGSGNTESSSSRPSGGSVEVEDTHPVMAHEGLQIYTVGHLLPRGTVDNGAWNSSPDTGANIAFIIGAEEQRLLLQQQNEFGNNGNGAGYGSNRSSVETEEEEIVLPTHNNPATAPSSSTRGSQSSSSTLVPSNQFVSSAGSSSSSSASSSTTTRKLRVRRSTFVPGWAVPPRVLLVDDDAVTRKLSSKFLQVFGCTIDVAVDGVGAVNKMNLEKYDLVLMDIVMPKLDGVSATSLIRKFDCMTPIISMTSNSKPNEILNYFSSGMNDILPKPFTKQGLLDMLEKHLTHLRAIQEMSRVPRPLELPNAEGSSSYLQNNSLTSDSSMVPLDDDGRINPIAGLGLTDEQYNLIVQDIVNAETFGAGMDDGTSRLSGPASGGMMDGPMGMMNMTTILMGEKRGLEEPSSDGREGKRSRFEVIE